MRERPAAPRESSPPFDRLVFGSFFMFPGPGFRAAKLANWAAVSNRRRLLARIKILRIAVRKHQWDRRLLGRWTGAHISYFLPKLYTARAGTRKSPGVNGTEVSRIIPFFSS
jgi:hypothetical protein